MPKSVYGDRETIGSIALQAAQLNQRVEAGDMAREFMPQLVDDINEAIADNPFDGRPFYIIVHEKKDLLLKNVILRRVVRFESRPYPEPATQVYWTNPATGETRFCWSLPHTSEFMEYLTNASRYSKEQIKDIVAYNAFRLDHFGFYKAGENEEGTPLFLPIKNFQDRKLERSPTFTLAIG
jgi:hypothetical protein